MKIQSSSLVRLVTLFLPIGLVCMTSCLNVGGGLAKSASYITAHAVVFIAIDELGDNLHVCITTFSTCLEQVG